MPKGKKPDKEATPVELALVKRGEIAAFLSSTANLRALREVTVSTQAEGIVQKVLAEEGDFVKEGQVLCLLDDTQVRIKLQLAAGETGAGEAADGEGAHPPAKGAGADRPHPGRVRAV